MNKKVIIIIAVVVILGIIAYWTINKNQPDDDYMIPDFPEYTIFNNQFVSYDGEHRSLVQVKTLYEQVRRNNEINDYYVTMKIDNVLVIGQNVTNGSEIIDKLSKQNKYTIECKDVDNDRFIDTITVTTEE